MPLSLEQQKLIDKIDRENLLKANENIRKQMATGVPVETIARPFGGVEGADPYKVLGAMSIAETHHMRLGEAYTLFPAIFQNTHGMDYNIQEVVKSYFTQSGDYELPFKYKNLEEFRREIEREEKKIAPEFKKEKEARAEAREEQVRKMPLLRRETPLKPFSFGGFNQAFQINTAVAQQLRDQAWFDRDKVWFGADKSEEKFVKGILTAETEEEKEALRKERLDSLITDQQNRIQNVRDFERRMESMKTDSPGPWLSKYYAAARGFSRIRMASYDVAAETMGILGKMADSGSVKRISDDMNQMSRAYWKALQEPEVTPVETSSFDRKINVVLENGPYVGTIVVASIIKPTLAPAFVFFNAAAIEGSAIKQQSLDNGISENSSRLRGWIGGTVNGLIEAAGGGAMKYNPKKLAGRIALFPAKLTNVALREIFMEEIPQEIVSMTLSGDMPRTDTGEPDWDAITNRFLILASDTAFCASVYAAGSSAIGEYSNWQRAKAINKESAQAMADAVEYIAREAEKPPEAPPVAEVPAEGVKVAEIRPETLKAISEREGPIMSAAVEKLNRIGIETTGSNIGGKGTFKSLQRGVEQEENTYIQFPEDNITSEGIEHLEEAGFNVKKYRATIPVGEGDYDYVPMLEVSKRVPQNLRKKPIAKQIDQWNKDVLGNMTNILSEHIAQPPAKPEAKRLISKEKFEEAKKRLTDRDVLRMGVDPQGFADFVTVGAYYVQEGVIKFAEWSKRMVNEFGQKVKPHLHRIWQEVRPTEDDQVTVESIPESPDLDVLIDETPPYGLMVQPDGKFAVLDWGTQKEIKTDLSEKQAVKLMEQYNSGQLDPPKRRIRNILPTSEDIETLTHRQLLNIVFKKVSQQSRKIVKETTDAILKTKKDLVAYAKESLEGLDITEGQRNSLLLKVSLAIDEKQKLATVSMIESIKEISRHKKAMTQYKKLRSFVNRASKRRISDGGIHYKVHEILTELLNNYTKLSPKILNTIKRAETYLDKLRNNIAKENGYEADYAEALIPKTITGKFRELAATRIQDMSADELEELNANIQHYLQLNQLWNKLVNNRKIREMKNFLNNAVATVKLEEKPARTKRFTPKRGTFKKLFDAFAGLKNDDIHTIATTIWGKFNPISNMVRHARRRQLELTMKYVDMLRKFVADAGITTDQLKRWSNTMQYFSLSERGKQILRAAADNYMVRIAGTDREMTMGEIMSLAMHFRNSYNLRRIANNGIAFKDLGEIGKLSPEEFSEILGIIDNDPVARAFVDAMETFYKEMANDINVVGRKLDGRNLATVDNYFHIEYTKEGGVIGTEYVRDSIMDEEGRLKPRTSSRRPVVIRDIFEILNEDIHVISNFAGLAEDIRKLRSLANYGPFREKLNKARHEHTKTELDARIGAMQRTRQRISGTIDRSISRMGRGVARAILINPVIWTYQPFSTALYFTEVSNKYIKAIRAKLNRQLKGDILQNWIFYRSRKEGIGASKSIAMLSTIRKILTNKNNFQDFELSGMHGADLWAISRAAEITFAEMRDPNMSGRSMDWWKNYGINPYSLEYGSEEFWQAFNDRADHIVSLTQPMFFAESRSEYSNSDNAFVREMARFRAFIDQIGRIVRRNVSMVEKNDIPKTEAIRNIALALAVVALTKPLLRYVWDKYAMGKEREPEDLFADILTTPFAIFPFIGYPASRIVQAGIGRERMPPEYSVMPIMLIDSILKHSWDIAKGLNYAFDDEYFQSGPHAGELKSEQFLKDGSIGLASDYLMFHGLPTKAIEQIEWWKE